LANTGLHRRALPRAAFVASALDGEFSQPVFQCRHGVGD
jgi:hypothetical protein